MKKSFSLLEIILVISLIGLLYTIFIPKQNNNKLDELTNRLSLYISTLRYKALIDNKYDSDDSLWHKQRWTIKFFRCRKSVGGIYYVIYSDRNNSGHPRIEDSLKDSLTNKNIYSTNQCTQNNENSKYVLLTKNFGISDINIACNDTTSLGQLSFGNDGKVYTKLSSFENTSSEYELNSKCIIKLITNDNKSREIEIYPYTSYNKI
uniref:type II secretion system protein n=1 Tax=Aliarcobacter sp. TaxID=2321116 RepID=UPI004047404C